MKEYLKTRGIFALIIIALLFLITPILQTIYFSIVPLEFIMNIESYSAPDITYGDAVQTITITRDLRYDFQGKWIDELYLVNNQTNQTIKVGAKTGISAYSVLEGNSQQFVVDVSDYNLQPGVYYWSYQIRAELPAGVVRNFAFKGNEFCVKNDTSTS